MLVQLDEADLNIVLQVAEDDLRSLAGSRILVTGGTGFVGTWLLSTLHHAHTVLNLDLRIVCLVRDPSSFRWRQHRIYDWVELLVGSIESCPTPGPVEAVIHAAAPTNARMNADFPLAIENSIVRGMESLLDAVHACGRIPLLLTSSGAVYGQAQPDLVCIPESVPIANPHLPSVNAYTRGKILAEQVALRACADGGPDLKLARLFSFIGPLLPLNRHYAVGNFLRDAFHGGPITIQGTGADVRSYAYPVDMVIQLLAILCRGKSASPYNVGSSEPISVFDVAELIKREVCPEAQIVVEGRVGTPSTAGRISYVPQTNRIRQLAGFPPTFSLERSVRKTADWIRNADCNG